MHSSLTSSLGAILASAFLAALAFAAPHESTRSDAAAPAGVELALAQPLERDGAPSAVAHDEPGDGRVWSKGATWKASFGPEGAVYYPRVGATDRTRALALSPQLVTLGGGPLALASGVLPVRSGERVEFDRGAFVERYDLAPETVEQSFVFESLPRAGDLVLHIPLGADFEPIETDSGIALCAPRGRVTYSRAVAIDARGRRTAAQTSVDDGAIVIRVDADVLAHAALPLVVDPLLNAIFPDTTTDDTLNPDTAYDPFDAVWVVVYEHVFSATDHDIVAKMYSATGVLITTANVDFTSDSWIGPRIASHLSAHRFLVVAGSTAASGGAKTIRGRIVEANGTLLTMDPQIPVSGVLSGDCVDPDVGGHGSASTPGSFCVVWERDISTLDRTIMYVMVSTAGAVGAPQTLSLVVGMRDENPSIAKLGGTTGWTIAFTRNSSPDHGGIQRSVLGARVNGVGAMTAGPFFVGGGPSAFAPCVSSPLEATDRNLVVWQEGIVTSTTSTTLVALLDGASVLQVANLKTLDPGTIANMDHVQPAVDSDGVHFFVSYSEFIAAFVHYELFGTDLAVQGNALVTAQSHLALEPGQGVNELHSNVAATRTSGTNARRYLVIYDLEYNMQDHAIAGRYVEGVLGGPVSGFCFGDGSSGACPCGNSGGPNRGCANSIVPAGAVISLASGQASTLADTAVIQLAGVPPGAGCVFFQGTSIGAPVFLGDGLFCTGGSLQRVGTRIADSSGVVIYPQSGDPTLSVRGGVPLDGGLRTYQATYRNAAAFCTSATFNVSSGLSIQWAP